MNFTDSIVAAAIARFGRAYPEANLSQITIAKHSCNYIVRYGSRCSEESDPYEALVNLWLDCRF